MPLYLGSLCCAQLCLGGGGFSEYITSFQEQLGSLFSIPILVRIASGICVLARVSGVPRNVGSTAVLGMMLPFWLGVHLCPLSILAVSYLCPKHLFHVFSLVPNSISLIYSISLIQFHLIEYSISLIY